MYRGVGRSDEHESARGLTNRIFHFGEAYREHWTGRTEEKNTGNLLTKKQQLSNRVSVWFLFYFPASDLFRTNIKIKFLPPPSGASHNG